MELEPILTQMVRFAAFFGFSVNLKQPHYRFNETKKDSFHGKKELKLRQRLKKTAAKRWRWLKFLPQSIYVILTVAPHDLETEAQRACPFLGNCPKTLVWRDHPQKMGEENGEKGRLNAVSCRK